MPVNILSNRLKFRDPTTGNYISVDAVADNATSARISEINTAGAVALNSISTQTAAALASLTSISELEGMIAGVFNASNNYYAGQYVIQNDGTSNKLYRFTAKYIANSGWANASKVEVKIGNEMYIRNLLLFEEIPGTTQSINYASDGSVSSVVFSINNTPIRTDIFTFATNTITEVRTLVSGENLTIATDTETLESTVTFSNS